MVVKKRLQNGPLGGHGALPETLCSGAVFNRECQIFARFLGLEADPEPDPNRTMPGPCLCFLRSFGHHLQFSSAQISFFFLTLVSGIVFNMGYKRARARRARRGRALLRARARAWPVWYLRAGLWSREALGPELRSL